APFDAEFEKAVDQPDQAVPALARLARRHLDKSDVQTRRREPRALRRPDTVVRHHHHSPAACERLEGLAPVEQAVFDPDRVAPLVETYFNVPHPASRSIRASMIRSTVRSCGMSSLLMWIWASA